jgi:penicillin-binding protein 1A
MSKRKKKPAVNFIWGSARKLAQWLLDIWDKWFAGRSKVQQALHLAIAGAGLVVVMMFLLVVAVYLGVSGPLPNYYELGNIRNNQASEVISADGQLLGTYFIENRSVASEDEIPKHLKEALIATEDARFFEHSGIDLRAWIRVLVKSILLMDDSSGGGSTLSQQLAKNLYPRQSYPVLNLPTNKIRELFVARRLENIYTKDELLNLYLNTVPFGDNVFGIKMASKLFFNKKPKSLKIEESAVLVGMLKGNTLYNPRINSERSRERRNVVLGQMAKYGYLSEQEARRLQAKPIRLDYQKQGHNEGTATHFREHLRLEVLATLEKYTKKDGTPYNLYTDGLKIFTTIDSRAQKYAEAAIAEQMPVIQENFYKDWEGREAWGGESVLESATVNSNRYKQMKKDGYSNAGIRREFNKKIPMTIFSWDGGAVDTLMSPTDSLKYYLTLLNTGLLAVEPQTGLVRAWVGGISQRFIQYDHVKSRRSAGSTIKPAVYAEALRQGVIEPCQFFPDTQVVYQDYKNYTPRNSNGVYEGAYSIHGAMAKSINTVAVAIAQLAGFENVASMIKQLGVDQGWVPAYPATALGAIDASLIEMTTMYATFANRGLRPSKLHYLDRIETADGRVLHRFSRPDPATFQRVLDANVSDAVTRLLQIVVDRGTGSKLRGGEFSIAGSIAGKTGTSQNQADGWFLGYTPRLAVGVWVGSELPSVHFRTLNKGQASSTALPIWGSFMREIMRNPALAVWQGGYFSPPTDMMAEHFDCPGYLDMMPSVEEYMQLYEDEGADGFDPSQIPYEIIQRMQLENPQQSDEDEASYQVRIMELADRAYRRELRRKKRQDFWDSFKVNTTTEENNQ